MRCDGVLVLACVGLVCGCGGSGDGSQVAEAPDGYNVPSILGLNAALTWGQLKDRRNAEIVIPWSDTYWAFQDRGTAKRWMLDRYSTPEASGVTAVPSTPFQQVNEMLLAARANSPEALAVLSPAEKYELLTRGAVIPPASVWRTLRSNDAAFRSNSDMRSALEGIEKANADIDTLRSQTDADSDRLSELDDQIEEIDKELALIAANLAQPEPPADLVALQARKAELEKARAPLELERTAVEERLNSVREQLSAAYDALYSFSDKRDAAQKLFAGTFVRVSQTMSTFYPMLSHGWKQWSYYTSQYEREWGWMGLCHGWAVASLYEPAPKHSVVAVKGGVRVPVSEGDIRGMLTHIWAEQPPKTPLAGKRCNAESLEFDQHGRVLDGRMCLGATGDECSESAGGEAIRMVTDRLGQGVFSFRGMKPGDPVRVAVVSRTLNLSHYRVAVYDSVAAYSANQARIRRGDLSGGKRALFKSTKPCRDVNPMTLHLALTDLLAARRRGFVMDRAREEQVWNQPVYKYELEYVPLPLRDGRESVAGEPVPVAQVSDAFADYRARGTKFLVQVKARLHYGVENGPQVSFQPGDDSAYVDDLEYTLELDAAQRLVGGEWGFVIDPQRTDSWRTSNLRYLDAPDFIWFAPQGATPRVGPLNYAAIKRLLACARTETGVQSMVYPGSNQTVRYSECPMD